MGIVFDLLLAVLLCYSVYRGYRSGFLVSASGIIAIMLASVFTKMFSLGVIGFVLLNILLSVAVAFCAKLIRKLKIPVVKTVDTLLGIGFGFIDGVLKVIIIALIAYFAVLLTSTDILEGSYVIDFIANCGIFDFVSEFIVSI